MGRCFVSAVSMTLKHIVTRSVPRLKGRCASVRAQRVRTARYRSVRIQLNRPPQPIGGFIRGDNSMAERIKLHPETPHLKRIFDIVDALKSGSVLLMPTDSQYALACDYQNKKGIERIRRIRNLDKNDHLTVMCQSLQHASTFAKISDNNFKLIRRLTPGPYTFILPATREVPRLLVHPKKKTVGIRIPDYPICLNLIREMDQPLLAITAKLNDVPNGNPASADHRELFLSRFDHLVDVTIDNQQPLPDTESTIVDLTSDVPELLRKGPGMEALEEAIALEGQQLLVA